MTGKPAGKPLSFKGSVMTKVADKIHAKLGKSLGLHVQHQDLFQPLY